MNIWIFNPYEQLPFEPTSPAGLRWSKGAVRLRYASLAASERFFVRFTTPNQQEARTKHHELGTKNSAPREFPIACEVGVSHLSAMSTQEEHPAVALAERRLKMHIAKHLPNARVWLFGSRATGAALRRSDFDLAVQPGSGTPDTELIDFETSIREDSEIIYPVDVVDLRRAPESLKQCVEKDGILWKN